MAILRVGTGEAYKTLGSAVAASKAGDTIQIRAGTYKDDFAVINHKLSIVGMDGRAHLTATSNIPNGKAILVVNADLNLTNIEFSGARVKDHNGAGIRHQAGHLTIENNYFHDNENGILSASKAGASVHIIDSEFARNGYGDGKTHGIYVNRIDSLTVENSYFHDTKIGHHIKSRAAKTEVRDSYLGGEDGRESYSIDLSEAGVGIITGNTIVQGATTQNASIIAYGQEGQKAVNSLVVADNDIVNYRSTATGIYNNTGVTVEVSDNRFYQVSRPVHGKASLSGNQLLDRPPTDGEIASPPQEGSSVTPSPQPEPEPTPTPPPSEPVGPGTPIAKALLINSGGNDIVLKAAGSPVGGLKAVTAEVRLAAEFGGDYMPVLSYAAPGNDNELLIGARANDGLIRVQVKGTNLGTTLKAADVFDGQAHTLTLTWNAADGALRLYLDGDLAYSRNNVQKGQTLKDGGVLVFGQEQDAVGGGFDPEQVFSGALLEARIFDHARTASEIAASAEESVDASTPGLEAQWRFGDFASGKVADASGNGHGLTLSRVAGFEKAAAPIVVDSESPLDSLTSTVATAEEVVSGPESTQGVFEPVSAAGNEAIVKATGALSINAGGADTVLQTSGAPVGGLKAVTAEVRLAAGFDGDYMPVLSYATASNDNELLIGARANDGLIRVQVKGTNIGTTLKAADVFDGNAHTLSLSWDSADGALRLYLDGELAFSRTGVETGRTLQDGGVLVFGQEQDAPGGGFDPNQVFDGALLEARLFDHARSAGEIAADVQTGADPSAPGLQALWRFGDFADGTVADASGNGHDLALVRIPGFRVAEAPTVRAFYAGTEGNDTFVADGGTAIHVAGGAGIDLLKFTGSGRVFDLRSGDFSIGGIETVDFGGSGPNGLILDSAAVAGASEGVNALTGAKNSLVISGGADDALTLAGSWTSVGPSTAQPGYTVHRADDGSEVHVADSVQLNAVA